MTSARERARTRALTFPDTWEDHPWEDDLVIKVRKKIFLFLGTAGAPEPTVGVKLVASLEEALQFEGVQPSRYGLGKHGWVQVPLGGSVPDDLVLDWVEESYRTVAPKTLVRQWEDSSAGGQR